MPAGHGYAGEAVGESTWAALEVQLAGDWEARRQAIQALGREKQLGGSDFERAVETWIFGSIHVLSADPHGVHPKRVCVFWEDDPCLLICCFGGTLKLCQEFLSNHLFQECRH
ncbi:unnamed protein product [Durusdinium trenchii]|uniref:Uncharacterized protein n=1 Tax=Durusdinium trenchii TaxID=1381693 RepID=A0ABP0K3X4_9DINO